MLGISCDLGEEFVAVDASINDQGEHALRVPMQGAAHPFEQGVQSATQIFVVVPALKINGTALGGVDVVAVDEFIRPTNGRAPASNILTSTRKSTPCRETH